MTITPEKARRILVQAKIDETYEGPIPEDDEKAVEEAQALYDMASQAWDQFVRGPEVESILRIANEDFGGEELPQEEPEAEEEEVPESAGEEPWEGYDESSVPEILKDITGVCSGGDENLIVERLQTIWTYEAANRNRQTIINKIEKIASRYTEDEDAEESVEGVEEEAPPAQAESEPGDTGAATEDEPVREDLGTALGGDGDSAELAGEELPQAPDAEPEPEPEALESGQEDRAGKDEAQAPAKDWRLDVAKYDDYKGFHAQVEIEMREDRLHVPKPPTEELPELPHDWSTLSDGQLQHFYSVFAYYAYYKNYSISKNERMAQLCKAAADEIANNLILGHRYDEKGREKKITLIEAEAESDPNVKQWRKLQRKHEAYATTDRRERDSYNKLVESMSRLESMRHGEWERSGKAPFKR